MNLVGEVALVTGAGRGIGRAIALRLAKDGAKVGLMSRTLADLEGTAAAIRGAGGTAFEFPGDVLKAGDVTHAVGGLKEAAGGVTILVNNAGSGTGAPVLRTSRALWDDMLALNLTSAFTVSQAAIPHMLEAGHGRIVNIASVAGLKGYSYIVAYCAAKHGLVGMTRALAVELAGKKITVNAVCPGYVQTPMTDRNLEKMAEKTKRPVEEIRHELELMNPQHRLFTPEEVAGAVAWVCLPSSRGITGQAIPVCGGEMAC